MIYRVHEIIKEMRADVSLAASSTYVLDELESRLRQIDLLEGTYIDGDEIAVYDPATGRTLFNAYDPGEEAIAAASAIRRFYTKGPESFR